MPDKDLPEWDKVLSAAARLQQIFPKAVLVGGTAAALHAGHRRSHDADHVITDLIQRFDVVLAELESVAGWKTARVKKPVLILGSLDGIETGVRQLIRTEPLETTVLEREGVKVVVPTEAEILRIKGVLILRRNATRDYLDFAVLADRMGDDKMSFALSALDRLYPQSHDESALQQLEAQLAQPLPYDLKDLDLREYRDLGKEWQDWNVIQAICQRCSQALFKRDLDEVK